MQVHDLKNIRNSDYWSHKLKPDYWVYSFSIPTRVLKEPCVVVNLQKNTKPEEKLILQKKVQSAGCILLDLSEELSNFSVTAAWLAACDEIYSCDTAVAHLADALGLKIKVYVRNKSIWYWLKITNTNTSFWYNSAEVVHSLNPKYNYMFEL